MPKFGRTLWAVLCAVASLVVATPVFAQSNVTNATFSGPVQLSGVVVPAGRYQFAVARDGRSVVVSDADHRFVTTFLVVPILRAKAGDSITMRPAVNGAPPEVSALYVGGGTTGVQLLPRTSQPLVSR